MRLAALVLLALGGCAAKTHPWTWERALAVLVGALGPAIIVVLIVRCYERWRR